MSRCSVEMQRLIEYSQQSKQIKIKLFTPFKVIEPSARPKIRILAILGTITNLFGAIGNNVLGNRGPIRGPIRNISQHNTSDITFAIIKYRIKS